MLTSLSKQDFPKTHELLNQAVAEGVAPGFVAGIWDDRHPDRFLVGSFGSRRIEPSRLPMEVGTVFDLASLTKIMGTAPLCAVLVERGWLSWETRLSSIFASYPHSKIKLSHLLSHTAGFLWWEPFYERIKAHFAPQLLWKVPVSRRQDFMRTLILSINPLRGVEEKVEYSDISFLLLGFALEEVMQMRLDQAVRKMVWDRMGLSSLHYRHTTRAPGILEEVAAATERSPWHGAVLQGQVHDENCWAMGGYSGHSGAFGTAEDVLRFSSTFFRRFLSESILREMWTPVFGQSRTLGWDTPSGETPSVGKFFSPRSVGHLGFTGTSLWIDPDARLAVTLLSNRVHLTRDNIAIRSLRPKFHDAIRMDLGR